MPTDNVAKPAVTDREIDALVAEKVMGGNVQGRSYWWTPEVYAHLKGHDERGDSAYSEGMNCPAGSHSATLIPKFTTDAACTDQVIERVRDTLPEFRRFEAHCLPISDTGNGSWIALIEVGKNDVDEHYIASSDEETRGRAVCLAALKAFGVEVPDA